MNNTKHERAKQATSHELLCMAAAHLASAVNRLAGETALAEVSGDEHFVFVPDGEHEADEKTAKTITLPETYDLNDDKKLQLRERKIANLSLWGAYMAMGNVNKARRTHECCTMVRIEHGGDGRNRMAYNNGCRGRLCPTCMWLLSRKVAHNITRMMNHITENDEGARFALLTLTQGRVGGENLKDEIDRVLKAWKLTAKLRFFERTVRGFVRALEVTHDVEPVITDAMFKKRAAYYSRRGLKVGDANPYYDTYNTHLHVILHVDKPYADKLRANESRLMEQLDWSKMWRTSLGIDYTPVVDIRPFNKERGHGAYELAKYVVKPDDYIYQDEAHLVETVRVMEDALYDRTLVAYSGSFRKARKEMALNDETQSEIDEDEQDTAPKRTSNWYWHFGYSQYRRSKLTF